MCSIPGLGCGFRATKGFVGLRLLCQMPFTMQVMLPWRQDFVPQPYGVPCLECREQDSGCGLVFRV